MTNHRLHEANRLSWNAATRAHNSHKLDQSGFLRDGGSTLFPEETSLLGDLRGRRLAHLLCNAGQDSLSLAGLGARVTGVDISDEAIAFARTLSEESGIPATFVRADVYDWLAQARRAGERFDLVFCSYGAICWLSDLVLFAQGVADLLAPGGRFACVEFHPVAWMFDEGFKLAFPYSGTAPLEWEEGVRDYVARSGPALAPSGFVPGAQDFRNPHPVHEFPWGVADVIGSLLRGGMTLERFEEYPFSNGCRLFEDMREIEGRRMVPPEHVPALPLMYGIAAIKR